MKDENLIFPEPKPRLWDLRFLMLTVTFGLLWVYLVAQGATAFQLVSNSYWLGLAVALAIEIGEVIALILWCSEAESKFRSWPFSAVMVAALLSMAAQYLAADVIAGDKIAIWWKVTLSAGITVLSVVLGKSAGERFSTWQAEFRQWKIAEAEWKLAEKRKREQREYDRTQEEEKRDYRRKRREKRERVKAEHKGKEQREIRPLMAKAQEFDIETLPDAYKERLKTLNEHLKDGKSISAEEAFIIMKIGKSQGYRILSAAHSAGILEKSGRKWKQGNGIRTEISSEIPTGAGTA